MGIADDALNITMAAVQERANAANAELATLSKRLKKKYTVLAINELNKICESAVNTFYSGYGPSTYRRTGALKNVYDVSGDPASGKIVINFTNSLPGHQDGAYIFYIVFELGYHGGSTGTDSNGITRSVPTYRTPVGTYSHWGNSAVKGVSPYKEIYLKANARFSRLNQQYYDEAYSEMDRILAKYGLGRR